MHAPLVPQHLSTACWFGTLQERPQHAHAAVLMLYVWHFLLCQVEVLHHVSTGVAWVTGRISSMNPELIQGWAGWVSADAGGERSP